MEEEVFLNGTDDALFGGDFNESLCSVNATAAAVEGLNCSKFVVAAKCVMSLIPMVSILPSLLSISLLAQWPPKFRNHKPHWVNGLVFGMSHMTMTMCVRIMVPARFLVLQILSKNCGTISGMHTINYNIQSSPKFKAEIALSQKQT